MNKSFVFADKPAGLATHSVDDGHEGFVEWLQKRLQQKLFVAHRLDKTTSGAMVFASSAQAAEELRIAFEAHKVRKRYLFVTASVSQEDDIWIFSKIEKRGNVYNNEPCEKSEANAISHFRRVKRNAFFELWEAFPKSGKTHQIRLHARQVGLPILGDTLYGGQKFPHLCLHSESLELPNGEKFVTAPPRFIERLGFTKDAELSRILSAIDRRLRLFNFFANPEQCFRLMHEESADYRLDLFGSRLWLYWYREQDPTPEDLQRWNFLSYHLGRPLLIRKMKNRGIDPKMSDTWTVGNYDGSWLASEGQLKFEFRPDQGLSPGLFLDQRENRKTVLDSASGQRVLNLFSYTCGFSVAAAVGGAAEVASVDVSASFLDWGKRNFQLNDLDQTKYEFFTADSFFFLERTAKKNRKFDLIILDPPSFSRSKNLVFSLEKDLNRLLSAVEKVLAPSGRLLICSNFEGWSREEFILRISRALTKCKVLPAAHGLDYELDSTNALLKGFWVSR